MWDAHIGGAHIAGGGVRDYIRWPNGGAADRLGVGIRGLVVECLLRFDSQSMLS